MKCVDTGHQQRTLSESVVSSHPLDFRQARRLDTPELHLGTHPARTRGAMEVRLEESQRRDDRACDFPGLRSHCARWRP